MYKYIVESLGTFLLVFTIGMTVIEPGLGVYAPLVIGLVLTLMIYAGAKISGAHYNPAVTISLCLRGRFNKHYLLVYIAAQCVSGVAAAVTVGLIKDNPVTVNLVKCNLLHIFLAEFVFTFALCYVILYVATSSKTRGNSYYGAAIGLTVVIGAYAVGAVSGGAFNPAVALGMAVMGLSATMNLWVYMAANFKGGILAAVVYKKLNPEDI